MWHPENIPLKKNYKAGQSPLQEKNLPLKNFQGGTVPPKIQALISYFEN